MADYTRAGTEFTLNTATAGEQYWPVVAGFAGGGFVVVWTTTNTSQDGSGWALKFQRYDATGAAAGSETLVNSATAGDQRLASVTTLASGDFLVTWETTDSFQDGAGTAIKARLFSGAGVALGSEFRVNTNATADQINSSVTALTNGGFVVAWETTDSTQDGLGRAIKAQRYDASGVAVGSEFLVNPMGTNGETKPNVIGLANGGFLASWTLGSGTSADIYAQLFDASGAKTGSAFLVSNVTAFNQDTATAVQLADGRIVMTWSSAASLNSNDVHIKARVFSAGGTPIGNEFTVNTTTTDPQLGSRAGSSKPQIDDLLDGGFVITWTLSSGTMSGTSIRGQFYDAAAQKVGSEVTVNTATDRFESDGDVAVDGYGRMLAVWYSSNSSAADANIRGQFYTAQSTGVTILSNGGGDTAAINVAENGTAVTTIIASGPAGIVYTIAGGADAARFTINATTGALGFAAAPNFEARLDTDFNGVYLVNVSATSGALTDFQQLSVTVTNVNEAPAFSDSTASFTYIENRTTPVANVAAVDPDGTAVAYSLTGADAAKFTISASGVLAFAAAPDFEAAADAGGNHVYDVTVTASDGSLSVSRALTVQLLNWNEGPIITSNGGGDTAAITVAENTQTATTITLFDPEGLQTQGYTYTLSGADAALFGIQPQTGHLYFGNLPDFEAPTDANGDGVYEVTVSVSDGFEPADTQALSITVINGNEAPLITSNGGGGSAAITLAENTTAVTTVAASDPEGGISYSVTGADAALFAIDASTGALRFLAAPNHEAPADTGADNVYNVFVRASDGALSDSQALAITVANVNEAVAITSGTAFTIADDGVGVTTVTATDLDGTAPVFAIVGGADAALFAIHAASGELSFIAQPDFGAPGDADGDNVYEVVVSASDGSLSDSRALTVAVVDAIDPVVITSNGGGDTAATSVAENTTAVTTVSASGGVGNTVYAITGGADAARFTIDATTGALAFAAAPNFEWHNDSNGDHVYEVTVSATSGALSDVQQLAVTVTNVNEAPVYIGDQGSTFSHIENFSDAVVLTAAMLDPEGDSVSYSLAGADAGHFTISATGKVAFAAAPDFENPADADGDNLYDITVLGSDGNLVTSRALTVEVLDWNEGPVITAYGGGATAALSVAENTQGVGYIGVIDPDWLDDVDIESVPPDVIFDWIVNADYEFTLSGPDAALFGIQNPTGFLYLRNGSDFEAPSDADGDGVYEVTVSVSDGFAPADSQALSITIANANETPAITSNGGGASAAIVLAENTTAVTTVAASDPEGGVSYAIAGGADAALFAIDAATGALSFLTAPDREAPTDVGANNVYDVVVRASDGVLADTQALAVTVAGVNEAPSITSDGGAATAAVAVDENATAVTIVVAADPEGSATVSYAITGGADAGRFQIDGTTGALAFAAAPDFEAPVDADGDNVYQVVVTASDGALADSQALAVSVGNRNDNAPVLTPFLSDTIVSAMAEGNAWFFDFDATDADGGPVSFSLAGADAASLSIDANGLVQFLVAPDYEAPGSSQGTNSYVFDVIASDGAYSDVLHVTLHVFNLNEPLAITSDGGGDAAALSVAENATGVTTVVAQDIDLTAPSYSITGGADAARFTIDAATGALAFVAAPDFEAPADADGDNVYEVVVSAGDGQLSDAQALAVTVTGVNETPTIVSDGGGASATLEVGEGIAAVTTVAAQDSDGPGATAYAIVGGADATRFTIDAATGALSFVTATDFEAPGDADGDNRYEVTVSASDGSLADTQALTVAVGNVNEAPAFVGVPHDFAVFRAENSLFVLDFDATDPDGDPLTFSISGWDAAQFTIDPSSGVLQFASPPDYENPSNSHMEHTYVVDVTVSDGLRSTTIYPQVILLNENEPLTIVSNGGGETAAITLNEGSQAVTTVVAQDLDLTAARYTIAGGADAARFTIDLWTGALRFIAAPNFEAPTDADGNNVYEVIVRANDPSLNGISFEDTQTLAVTVANVDEAPVIVSNGGGATAALTLGENTLAVTTVLATDTEGAPQYALTGGADAARFAIDAATGALRFVSAPNFEAPTDANGNNVYEVIVSAFDGQFSDTQALSVTVANVNEAPVITSGGGGATASYALNENATAVATIAASDPVCGVTSARAGGADAARFTINAATGALSFVAAPDFDAPGDADGNNIYEVTVSASDGSLGDSQALTVTVANLVDGLTLNGTSGANTINGSYEEDTINGLGGNDNLAGAGAADTLDGGAGQDRLAGGSGADRLTGGAAADRFEYYALNDSTVAASDVILDFSHSQGDRIVLDPIDANALAGGDQAFSFIGGGAFSHVAGQLRYFQQGGDTFVQADVNGDGLADFQVVLDTLVNLTASDFVL